MVELKVIVHVILRHPYRILKSTRHQPNLLCKLQETFICFLILAFLSNQYVCDLDFWQLLRRINKTTSIVNEITMELMSHVIARASRSVQNLKIG